MLQSLVQVGRPCHEWIMLVSNGLLNSHTADMELSFTQRTCPSNGTLLPMKREGSG
jgi:hypothetical protein